MAVIEINRTSDLDRPIAVDVLPGVGFTSEQLAHKFVISATKSGSAVTLSGGVVARVLRADDAMVLVQGTIANGKATITLSKDCYKIPGQISIAIMVSETSTVTTCVYAAVAQIRRSDSDSIVDNDRVIPSIDEILAQLSVMEAATNAANTAADAANTAASNANSKATAANTAASTANTAASNADAKATLANTAASTANTAASNADSKAALANTAAGTANTAAANANEKAAAAETATTAANNAAASATTAAGNADTATARANAAAETIEDMTVAGTRVAPTAPAAAAISTVDGHYHIDFSIPQGVTGAGAAIASQVTEYQNSTSGTTVPTGSWLTEQPNTPQGQFLWARRTITWNSGDTTVLYSVSRMGIDGSGSVVSVNGQAPDAQGDVSLLGSGITVSGSDTRTVAAAIAANATAISDLGTATQQAIDDLDAATVKSVNSATPDSQGNVELTGADLNVSSTDTRSIDTVVSDIDTALDSINTALGQKANSASLAAVATSGKYSDLSGTPGTASTSANGLMASGDKTNLERIKNINGCVAIFASGSTAPSAIAAGQYVIWNGALYTARSAISSGATLSTSNLAAVSNGGLNALKSSVDSLNSNITTSKRTIESGESLIGLIASLVGTGGDLHKFMLFTCTGTRATDIPATIEGISVRNYGQGWVEANGYYHTAYYRDAGGNVFTAHKTHSDSSWNWSAVSNVKQHPLIYSVTTAAEIPTETEIQNFFTSNQGIEGSIVVNFVYNDVVRSTLYYCAASYAYGAGILVSYYGGSWYKVKVSNKVATITAM